MHVGGLAFGVDSGTDGIDGCFSEWTGSLYWQALLTCQCATYSPPSPWDTLSVCLSIYPSSSNRAAEHTPWVTPFITCLMSLCFELLEIHGVLLVICFFGVFPQDSDHCGWRCLFSGDGRRSTTPKQPSEEGLYFCFSSFLGQRSWYRLILELGTSTLCVLLSAVHFASQID